MPEPWRVMRTEPASPPSRVWLRTATLHPLQQAFIDHDCVSVRLLHAGPDLLRRGGLIAEGRAKTPDEIPRTDEAAISARCAGLSQHRLRRSSRPIEGRHESTSSTRGASDVAGCGSAGSQPIPRRNSSRAGTNLLDLMKDDIERPSRADRYLAGCPLKSIDSTDEGGLRIGALVPNTDLAWHPLIEQRYPLLSRAILGGAHRNSCATWLLRAAIFCKRNALFLFL